jgi:hypothetical protein
MKGKCWASRSALPNLRLLDIRVFQFHKIIHYGMLIVEVHQWFLSLPMSIITDMLSTTNAHR